MIGAANDPRPGVEARIGATPTTAFGKYQVFASLGRGGMADVFLAVARSQIGMGVSKLAVIKRLRQSLAEESGFRTMFLDEARLASRLSHPNIVHTYEVGEQDGVYFIAMEYLEGQPLNVVLKEAIGGNVSLEPEIGVRIISDALSGLAYAHDLADYDGRPLGIVHRDVSPHNIFVTYDGHTKLVDFGIAKAALSSTETEVGVLKGKIAYMSPEQATGGPIDRRADLFAMGIVLWELLAEQRLMSGENAANTLHKLMNEPIARLSTVVPSIDRTLEAIVTKSLAKDPDFRFQSAAEMRDALEDWLRTKGRPLRQDEVGRIMQRLFAEVRADVRREVRRHVTEAAGADREMASLTADLPLRSDPPGALGSSVGPSPTAPSSSVSMGLSSGAGGTQSHALPSGTLEPSASDRHASRALSIVIAVGFFVLTALLILVIGLRDRRHAAPSAAGASAGTAPSSLARAVDQAPEVPVAADRALEAGDKPSAPTAEKVARPPATGRASPTPLQKASASHHSPAQPSTSPAEEPGFLTLNVYPWAKVSEAGRVLCVSTPCNKIVLSPGSHTLQLENPEQGVKQTTTVMIKSGVTTTRAIGFK